LAAIMKKNGTGELQNPWWVTACLPTFGAWAYLLRYIVCLVASTNSLNVLHRKKATVGKR
jgi:hypothetical protein